jgi:hypothetical protein
MASQPRLTVFFVLSKLLAFFTQPSNLVVLLGLIGLALTRTRFARAGWRLAAGSLVLIGLIGFLPLGRALSLPLENRFRRRPASSHAGDPGGRQPRSGQAQGIWGAALAEGRTRGDRKAAGSSCGRRGLSRKRSVNPADGMLQPPRVAQFGEDAAAARGTR